jgi:hydroxymethylpyrimidine pyrophosphatase-like HAD family hydrolase
MLRLMMLLPIQLLSTDFDGTLHAEFENPPVPAALQDLIAGLQAKGLIWIINTGRDLSSLMETLGRSELSIWPDYVVTVEREIHCRSSSRYIGLEDWNHACHLAHEQLFARIRPDLPRLMNWVKLKFKATIYEDAYSPFCLIAGNNGDADLIHAYLESYCSEVPDLAVVRNDVYARFCHAAFNKGSALAEVAGRLGIPSDRIVAVGDHLNDLPMLSQRYAKWLIAPGNAVQTIKDTVRRQNGYISEKPHGDGVLDGLDWLLKTVAKASA